MSKGGDRDFLGEMWSEKVSIMESVKEVVVKETVVEIECGEKREQRNKERNWLGRLIVVYFDVAYYLALSPFRIVERKGEFDVRTWWISKITWIVVLIPCFLFRTAESRNMLQDFGADSSWNPTAYFRIFHAAIKLLYHVTVWFYLAFRSSRYLDLVNYLVKCSNLPVPEKKGVKFWKFFGPFVCILFVNFGMFLGLTHLARFNDCGRVNDGISGIFKYYLKLGRYVLFLDDERVNCENGKGNVNFGYGFFEILISLVTMVTTFFRQLSGFYEELHLVLGIIVFWICAKEFAERLENMCPSDLNWGISLKWYLAVKELSILVKMAYGNILLYRLALMVFDVPISFNFRSDKTTLWKFFIFLMTNTLAYLLAADASKQVNTFESWISKTIELNPVSLAISQKQLSVVLYELQTNAVGISSSEGFTITYSFVANVSGIILTYFIICIQNNLG